MATTARAFSTIDGIIKRPARGNQRDDRFAEIEYGFGKRALDAGQAGVGPARRFAAHIGGFAKAQKNEIGVLANLPRGGNAGHVRASDRHPRRKGDLGLRQRRREAFADRDRIGRASGNRPRPKHLRAGIGERTDERDAAQGWRQRQHMVIGKDDDRAPRRVARELKPGLGDAWSGGARAEPRR